MHGMAVVAAAWSRLPRAATSPGAVAVGMQKQGQRQRHRQGQGQGRGQEEGQGQKSTGALQGWVEASETTPGAGYGAINASPPSPSCSSSSSLRSSLSSSPSTPPSSLLSPPPPTGGSTSSSHATTSRKAQPEATSMQTTPRATTSNSCRIAATATRTKNSPANDSARPKSSKAYSPVSSNSAPEKRAKHTAPAPVTATSTAKATTSHHKSTQGKSTGRQPIALAAGEAVAPAKRKVTALMSTVTGAALAAAGWLLVRASSSSAQASSAGHSQDKGETSWNHFFRDSRSHTMGDRHPSWSNRANNPNDDADAPLSGNQVGDSQASSACLPPEQGRGHEVDAKEGNGNVRSENDEQRGGGAETDGDIEREWPVFGSDGVGGRFGAF